MWPAKNVKKTKRKMRTLVLPDVHQRIDKVEKIIENNTFDTLISLGDWFDDFYDTPDRAEMTAQYILKLYSRYGERFIWLLGNHDVPYLYPALYDRYACSGNTRDKLKAINRVFLGSRPLGFKTKLAYAIRIENCLPIILSHAGVSEHHFGQPFEKTISADSVLSRCYIAESFLALGVDNPILNAGIARGGQELVGGINWLDWNHEYAPVEGLSQIVGHTPLREPVVIDELKSTVTPDQKMPSIDRYELKPNKSYNINIDTHLEHYLTIEDNALLIHKTSALID
jgi:hypothetical protein